VISRRACVLFKREKQANSKPLRVDADKCIGCRLCLGLGCPPIAWKSIEHTVKAGESIKKTDGIAVIDRNLCSGCGLCRQLCKSGAILEEK
jgi:indolepyruvate ferredoxin oxidoreductase alpha subunit